VFVTSFPSRSVIFVGCLDGFERFEQASAQIWVNLPAVANWGSTLSLWNEVVWWARRSLAPWFRRVLAVNCLNLPASVRAFSEFSGQFGCRPVCKLAYSIREFLH
jgi:hypothetical protein